MLLFFALYISLFSIDDIKKERRTPKGLPTPPNTIWLEDSLFVDATEIANIHWAEFLFAMKQEIGEQEAINKYRPDSLLTQAEGGDLYEHPAYHFKPIMGITYEQALAFCEWRSEVVTKHYNQENPKEKYYWKFTYRLPSKEEWEKAALAGEDVSLLPWGLEKLERIDKNFPVPQPLINYRNDKTKGFQLKAIKSYEPNHWGIYNMVGNVAEMTNEKGVAKGGSWFHRLNDCKIRFSQKYEKAELWLGFRCVCEIEALPKAKISE